MSILRRRAGWAFGILSVGVALGVLAPARPSAAASPKDWKPVAARLDDLVVAGWRTEKDLVPAPRSDDAEFLRRVYLDLTGVVPKEDEAVAFLNDPAPEKRSTLVDRLLASPRYAQWFTTWYSNLLLGTSMRDRDVNRRTFNDWMRDQFRGNRPYDQMVYDLVTASGNSETNGSVGFLSSFQRSAADAAGKTSRYFLGVQIQCAQCHDHPYDKRIKKEDFASFAAFFFTTTTRRNMTAGNAEVSFDVASYPKEELRGGRTGGMAGMARGVPLSLEGDVRRPGYGGDLPDARFLLGKVVKDVPGVTRRDLLGRWITSQNNPWFAQAFVNRLWGTFFARGIVHPVDDFSQANKPSHPELLKYLGEQFERSGFDVQFLLRAILNSETYQRTSRMPRDRERPDASLFAVASVRPLSVEQSFDSLFRVGGVEEQMERGLDNPEGRMGMGGRRGSLVDPRMAMYRMFRRSFDDDEQGESEEFTGTIPRGLLMLNGQQVLRMLSKHPGAPLTTVMEREKSDRERVRRLYLTVLSRPPSPGELSNALTHVQTSRGETEGYEDLFWALCNTTEFMSNH